LKIEKLPYRETAMNPDSGHIYMERALELAREAEGRTFPNPLVGAVIESEGRIVGEGYHRGAGMPHAEIEALRAAGPEARGGMLYLNLEPCCHHGKTPPCTDAIIEAGIARVVFSVYDPDERVRGCGADALRSSGIDVVTGLRAAEALELNLPYMHRKLTGRAHITLKLASTLDGRLTTGDGRYITGTRAREHVHRLRAASEAIAVGIGTFEKDAPLLDRRLHPENLPPPVRMIFDTGLRFPPGHEWLRKGERVILFCSEGAPSDSRRILEEGGAEVVCLPPSEGGVDLEAWRDSITEMGITSVLVEGGGSIATSFIEKGCFDRMVLYYAPVLSGDGGVVWYDTEDPPGWSAKGELVPRSFEMIGEDTMAVYDRREQIGFLDMVTREDILVHRTD
jgi:diaminohydroxyphosphoribosylaminopyrimidine deaminase/5-amino-6-(5-phosphoribosylamino)uracil reductase